MTSAPAIEVVGVSKRYCRSLKKSLRYGVADIAKELTGKGQEAHELRPAEFWALGDVSLSVGAGESVGLIGQNGAGKTTLLKLMNGLVKPTTGSITIRGTVRALIALGTGFNPILTGRENIRIASAVLGFGEAQTKEKFDEIVEFSELEEFIDAPVQSYSSGMLARLGFSVAVHTRPDILLVDEVLAVGDLRFGMKCFKKIAEFRSQGGAIVLVSHSPYTVRTNCDRVVWLEHGGVRETGEANDVCDAYEAEAGRDGDVSAQQYGDGTVRVVELSHPPEIGSGEPFRVRLTLESDRAIAEPIVQMGLSAVTGQHVAVNDTHTDDVELEINAGRTTITLTYASLPLRPGVYSINVVVCERLMTNMLLMDLGGSRVEVRRELRDHGVGFVSLKPDWDTASSHVA